MRKCWPCQAQGAHYHAFIVFAAAFDPLSTAELTDFSSAVDDFDALDCELVGLARDSSMVIKEWMLEVGKCLHSFYCLFCLF